ncbi:MAG TPA: imidazole glycerol phosphate synthase subunit HisF [Polyangiaceae bacterium]|jgi:imidazole glycerol-phosphate synthase subunit HisF|nr:imidazole glycerol phosphate synthase subunit HisF [Polyangiaceae bacterium]
MLSKRVIVCLDVKNGKLAKSVKFVDTKELGDPVAKARQYYEDGVDELVFYDITASSDARAIVLDVVNDVASQIFIPFSVGGGIRSTEDATNLRLAGAEKINVNSAAVRDPDLITRCSDAIGAQSVVLSMDVKRTERTSTISSGFEIVINGGRVPTGIDAIEWAKRGQALGAGEIVVNSIDADGTREGFDIELTRTVSEAVSVPVVASGGAGSPAHVLAALTEGKADAAIVASIVHYGTYSLKQIKTYLHEHGVKVRLVD